MSAPETPPREQAVAPGRRAAIACVVRIQSRFAFGCNPVPCAHIRCRVPSLGRTDQTTTLSIAAVPCLHAIDARPDMLSRGAKADLAPQGDSLTLSSFGCKGIRRVDLVAHRLVVGQIRGTLRRYC